MVSRKNSLLIITITILSLGVVGCAQIPTVVNSLRTEARRPPFFHRIWAKNLDPPYQTGNLPITTLAPTIYQEMLFQGAENGGFFAYSLRNGRLLWRAKERAAISSAVAIWGKNVIYGDLSGRIYARNFASGKLAYSFDIKTPAKGKAIFSQGTGFIHTRNHSIVAFDAESGGILWSFKRNIPYAATVEGVSDPLVYQNRLIVGFADGYLASLAIADGLLLWEKKMFSTSKFVDVDVTAKIHQGNLYVGSHGGNFSRLNPSTGEILQRFNFRASSSPLFIQKKIFVGTLNGDLAVLNHKGILLKRISLSAHTPVTTVLWWKQQVVLGNANGELFQIDPDKLAILSRLHFGHHHSAIYGELSSEKRYLAVMSARNRLYVFQ